MRYAEYYGGADRATYAEANLIRAVPGVPSEAEREVHADHGTSVEQDPSRPGPRRSQGPAPCEFCPRRSTLRAGAHRPWPTRPVPSQVGDHASKTEFEERAVLSDPQKWQRR